MSLPSASVWAASSRRNVPGLMAEFGAVLQFFQRFWEHWHALEECICYMDEWLPGDGYVLVVERAEELLADEPDEMRWFVAMMKDVADWWANPVVDNGRFNRPPRPFKVMLEVSEHDLGFCRRMEAAGADLFDWNLGAVPSGRQRKVFTLGFVPKMGRGEGFILGIDLTFGTVGR